MGSIRKPMLLVATAALVLGTAGCATPDAHSQAVSAAAAELAQVTKAASETDAKSVGAFTEFVRSGGLGEVLPSPVPESYPTPESDWHHPYAVTSTSESARIDVVVWGTGTGPGYAGGQAAVYLCVRLAWAPPSPDHVVVQGIRCRADVAYLLGVKHGMRLVHFGGPNGA